MSTLVLSFSSHCYQKDGTTKDSDILYMLSKSSFNAIPASEHSIK